MKLNLLNTYFLTLATVLYIQSLPFPQNVRPPTPIGQATLEVGANPTIDTQQAEARALPSLGTSSTATRNNQELQSSTVSASAELPAQVQSTTEANMSGRSHDDHGHDHDHSHDDDDTTTVSSLNSQPETTIPSTSVASDSSSSLPSASNAEVSASAPSSSSNGAENNSESQAPVSGNGKTAVVYSVSSIPADQAMISATVAMFERAGWSVTTASSNLASAISGKTMIVVPGSNSDTSTFMNTISSSDVDAIYNFVYNGGGRYYGICMGAYVADSSGFGLKDGYVGGRPGFGVVESVTFVGEPSKTIYVEDPPDLGEHTDIAGQQKVISRFTDGMTNAYVFKSGNGFVGLIAGHPEGDNWGSQTATAEAIGVKMAGILYNPDL